MQQSTQIPLPSRPRSKTNRETGTVRSAGALVAPSLGVLEGRLIVPGLDEASPFSSRLSSRAALYTELHLLLGANDAPHPAAAGSSAGRSSSRFQALVLEDNLLARSTTSGRAKLWKELRLRYRLDTEHPLFAAFLSEWQRCASEPERALTAYVLFALNDRLVTVLGTEWLFPLLRRAPADLRVADVEAFISRAAPTHPEVATWSVETRGGVARKYCTSIRDFGLAKGAARKVTVRPALYGAPVRLLVRALRLAGVSPLALIRAPAFRLVGVDGHEVIDALGELNRAGELRFRMQADVVELDVERRA